MVETFIGGGLFMLHPSKSFFEGRMFQKRPWTNFGNIGFWSTLPQVRCFSSNGTKLRSFGLVPLRTKNDPFPSSKYSIFCGLNVLCVRPSNRILKSQNTVTWYGHRVHFWSKILLYQESEIVIQRHKVSEIVIPRYQKFQRRFAQSWVFCHFLFFRDFLVGLNQ